MNKCASLCYSCCWRQHSFLFGDNNVTRKRIIIMDSLLKHEDTELKAKEDSKSKTNLFQALESTLSFSTKPELPVFVPFVIDLITGHSFKDTSNDYLGAPNYSLAGRNRPPSREF